MKVRGIANYRNVSPLVGRLVSSGLATLRELQECYSLEDAYSLDEILTIRNYHEWLGSKQDK